MRYALLVDLGTGNTRVALANSAGELLDIRTYTNRYYRDDFYEDAQYFLPHEWEEKILQGCCEICKAHPDIRIDAISSAGARQSFVLLDNRGDAFYGLPNIDNRGRAYISQIPKPEEIYRISGKWCTEDFGAAKLLGLRQRRPEIYAQIAQITSISEWVGKIFTGRVVIEPSQACESQLYDIRKNQWSIELCSAYGVNPAMLPPLQNAGTVLGPVLPIWKKRLSLTEDAVFIVGGADTQVALRQTGIRPGDIAVVSGTTSPVVTMRQDVFHDPGQRVWVDSGLQGTGYQVEMNPGVTGLNYQRARETFCPDLKYEELETAYAQKRAFSCTASFSSLLFYQRRSLKRGGFFLSAPLSAQVSRTDLLWAVLADVGCSIYEQLSNLCALTENRSSVILGCGGGFQSRALCQMLADLSGRTLTLNPGFEQATVRGLVQLCNEEMGGGSSDAAGEIIRYTPRECQLIHQYYPEWKKDRERVNSIDQ